MCVCVILIGSSVICRRTAKLLFLLMHFHLLDDLKEFGANGIGLSFFVGQ
jgi:hypothetical protein